MPKAGDNSPWGRIQHAREIVPGITVVDTAGHGGIHVDAAHLAKMPDYMRATGYSHGGWFEEDCDWCLPFCVFEAEIREGCDVWAIKALDDGAHLKTLRNWHTARYKRFFGVTVGEVLHG